MSADARACTYCDDRAVTALGGVRFCDKHWKEYAAIGEAYNGEGSPPLVIMNQRHRKHLWDTLEEEIEAYERGWKDPATVAERRRIWESLPRTKGDAMRTPDQEGPAAKGWIVPTEQFERKAPAHLASWMVVGDGFHLLWDTWIISTCHLRDVPGVDPPKLDYPGAEYEIVIAALDPNHGPYDPDHLPQGIPRMTPIDLVKQFDGCSDEQAARLVGLMVREICAGRASPDSDYQRRWDRIIDYTVSHYKAGLHDGEGS
jgi:hypothetical protein